MADEPRHIDKRIAVLVVHGVGPHEPRHSAHAIARMLTRVPLEGASDYSSFGEHRIELPTRRVPEALPAAATSDQATSATSAQKPWSERSSPAPPSVEPGEGAVSTASSPAVPSAASKPALDVAFMAGQLQHYAGAEQDGSYDTVRLEGRRRTGEATEADVHIYEMYWTDISQIGQSVLSIFGAFYQTVIHLPYVGGWTLEHVTMPRGWRSAMWSALRMLYASAQRSLTLFAPTLNIILLALGTSLLTRHVPNGVRGLAAMGVVAVVLFATVLWLVFHSKGRHMRWWILIALVPAASVLLISRRSSGAWAEWALIVEWWVATAFPLWLLFSAFEKNRPLARTLGRTIWLAGSFLLAWFAARDADPGVAVLHALEVLGYGLSLTWIVFGFALLGVIVLGVLLPVFAESVRQRRQAWRATYTARFALTLPAVAFSVATLLVWGGLVAAESTTAFGKAAYTPVIGDRPALEHRQAVQRQRTDSILKTSSDTAARRKATEALQETRSASYFLRSFWGPSDTVFGVIGVGLLVLVVFMLLSVLLPIVITEWRSPRSPPDAASSADFDTRSLRLGYWLNFAFKASRIGGELLGVICLLALIANMAVAPYVHRVVHNLLLLNFATGRDLGVSYANYGRWLVSGAGTVGALVLLSRLSRVGLGLRPVLGIAVDVDNYLRELPRDRTPRARMAERYTSLLRYVCRWRAKPEDPASGYDALVIVAHSQGTVITVDLLRYLRYITEQNAALEPRLDRLREDAEHALPIHLLTMGSPVRQLYALRFPHLYEWVGYDDASGPSIATMLGVKSWRNAFRSADYVGRAIWLDDAETDAAFRPFEEHKPDKTDDCLEECIGPGAHTHYWDETAPSIGDRIDQLIGAISKPVVKPVVAE
jgi:hypothetical protein